MSDDFLFAFLASWARNKIPVFWRFGVVFGLCAELTEFFGHVVDGLHEALLSLS